MFLEKSTQILVTGICPSSFIQSGPERRELVNLRANIGLNISFIQKGAHLCF